jgi:site-specific DNA recombinase
MRRPCISGRYSTDRQNETSLEVQVRNCRALAARDGLTIDDADIFLDHAVSGQAKGTVRRTEWRRLLDAWDAGLVSVVFANELSRLTRDGVEGAELKRRVERTGVHVVTNDGIDTRLPGWHFLWDVKMAFNSQEVRSVARRTADSMPGVAERGGMLAAPAFGYQLDPMRKTAADKGKGARWMVHEGNAALVREMYRRRRAGEPHYRIAAWLNGQGIPSPRKGRDGQPSS